MAPKLTIPALTTAAFLLATPCVFAQQAGVSHPESLDDNIMTTPMPAAKPIAKPSPAIPMDEPVATSAHYVEPKAEPRAETPVQTAEVRRDTPVLKKRDDPTAGVVMEVASGPNELPIGTMLKAQLSQEISTKETQAESRFQATLTADVMNHGRVLLPVGTVISGRVTQVHGGRRIKGPAAIRLQPDIVKLPGGMAYELEAEVIDLDHFDDAHVNSEGTILSNTHTKATLGALSLTTGSAAVAGALIGGGVGALVGAGIGAGVGTIWWLKRDHQETLPENTSIVFSLDRPLILNATTH